MALKKIVILQCKLAMHNEHIMSKLSSSVCSKFSQLRFCEILFELVYSWESYPKNKKNELFIETQCSYVQYESVYVTSCYFATT